MIVYLDASALVKRYIAEAGSEDVRSICRGAAAVGTSIISRAEVAAAIAKAARLKAIQSTEAAKAVLLFAEYWGELQRVEIGEATVERAAVLAWDHGLRGYDAVHLACALLWQERLDEPLTLATYDRELWDGAKACGLTPWPPKTP